jgi:adenylate cyclase
LGGYRSTSRRRCRVTIKLVRFIMGHLIWIYLGVLALVGAIASQTSITLAVVLVIACVVALEPFLHNSNPLTPWLRERDDQVLFDGCRAGGLSAPRRTYRWLPSDPRCRVCLVPFGGVGKLLRITPSRKNPDFCTDCLEAAPVGTYEREVGILFADIRGFTAWSEKRSPAEVADRLTRFYSLASRVLTRDDALVEFVGDQVMALYLPDFPSLGKRTSEVMISAAERLLSEIDRQQAEDMLPVGVGIHIGVASVGNVGKGKTKDFTAVGDVVNTAARLQSSALAGQIVLSDETYARAAGYCPQAEPVSLSLKGKSEPVRAHVIHAH